MKTIQLIRHAKSSWEHSHLSDVNRPLNKRGTKDCGIMADALYSAGVVFNQVYSSRAQRAQLTIQNIAKHWTGRTLDWQVMNDLYTFSSSQVWSIVQQLSEDLNHVTLVGHNPAFTDFVFESSNEDLINLPTCGFVHLSFAADQWQACQPKTAEMVTFMKPKMFK